MAGGNFLVPVTPTVQAVQYSASMCMGGLLTLPLGVSGIVTKILLASAGGDTVAKVIYLFWQNPVNSIFVDKTAITLATADLPKLLCSPYTITPSVPQGATASVGEAANLTENYGFGLAGGNLYAAIVATANDTPGSTTDLVLSFGGIRDYP